MNGKVFKYFFLYMLLFNTTFIEGATFFAVLQKFDHFKTAGIDSADLIFIGKKRKVAYTKGRTLDHATFIVKNLSNEPKEIILLKVYLAGVKIDTELENPGIIVFQKGRSRSCNSFTIRPKSEQEFKVTFKPFEFYPGYQYAFEALISVNGEKFEAVSRVEIIRSRTRDRNWFKDKRKK